MVHRLASLVLLCLFHVVSATTSTTSTYPSCVAGWEWANDAQGFSPCNVWQQLWLSCMDDPTTDGNLPAVTAGGYAPAAGGCDCTKQNYNLQAACSACQDGPWSSWSSWIASSGCVGYTPSTGVNPYASSVSEDVPGWANLPLNGDMESWEWSVSGAEAYINGGSKKFNAGAIAGGTVGGIVVIAALTAFLYWYRRNRRLVVVPSPQRTVDPEAKVGNHGVGEVGLKATEVGYAYVIGGSAPNGGYAPPQLDAYNTGYAPPEDYQGK